MTTEPIVYGDTPDALRDHSLAGSQDLIYASTVDGVPVDNRTVVGDANALLAHATGGNDTIDNAVASGTAESVGDALTLAGHGHGGDDVVTSTASSVALAYGDALEMTGHSQGGDDTVSASALSVAAYGDARTMSGYASGGDDQLSGLAHGAPVLFGDAEQMGGHTTGGNDTITGPATMYGDAAVLRGHAHGGDDLLLAHGGPIPGSAMYGDGLQLLDHAQGGDDTLVAGAGGDTMWGDAPTVGPHAGTGADLFVFGTLIADDQVMDFQPGKDRIELQGTGIGSFQDLAAHLQATSDGTQIDLDSGGRIFLHGVTTSQLSSHDFIFTG